MASRLGTAIKILFWVGVYTVAFALGLGFTPWWIVAPAVIGMFCFGALYVSIFLFMFAWHFYKYAKYGDPFHEYVPDAPEPEPRKRQRHYCEICKRDTFCRVTYAPGFSVATRKRFYVHVARG